MHFLETQKTARKSNMHKEKIYLSCNLDLISSLAFLLFDESFSISLLTSVLFNCTSTEYLYRQWRQNEWVSKTSTKTMVFIFHFYIWKLNNKTIYYVIVHRKKLSVFHCLKVLSRFPSIYKKVSFLTVLSSLKPILALAPGLSFVTNEVSFS